MTFISLQREEHQLPKTRNELLREKNTNVSELHELFFKVQLFITRAVLLNISLQVKDAIEFVTIRVIRVLLLKL